MKHTPEELMAAWNSNRGEMLGCAGLDIKNRRSLAEQRLQQQPDLHRWTLAIRRASESAFCTGHLETPGQPTFIANFDWLLKPETLQLIEEGQFDHRGFKEVVPPEPGEIQKRVKFETYRDEKGRLWARPIST